MDKLQALHRQAEIVAAINHAMTERGVNLSELERRTGKPYATLHRKLVQGAADVTLPELFLFAAALQVKAEEFLKVAA